MNDFVFLFTNTSYSISLSLSLFLMCVCVRKRARAHVFNIVKSVPEFKPFLNLKILMGLCVCEKSRATITIEADDQAQSCVLLLFHSLCVCVWFFCARFILILLNFYYQNIKWEHHFKHVFSNRLNAFLGANTNNSNNNNFDRFSK